MNSSSSSDSLAALRMLTPDLPPFPGFTETASGFMRYKTLRGTMLGWEMLNLPKISVVRIFSSKDTMLAKHAHEQRELIAVYSGSLTVTIDGQEPVRLLPGMHICIEPRTVHTIQAPEDSWAVALTVPHSPDLME